MARRVHAEHPALVARAIPVGNAVWIAPQLDHAQAGERTAVGHRRRRHASAGSGGTREPRRCAARGRHEPRRRARASRSPPARRRRARAPSRAGGGSGATPSPGRASTRRRTCRRAAARRPGAPCPLSRSLSAAARIVSWKSAFSSTTAWRSSPPIAPQTDRRSSGARPAASQSRATRPCAPRGSRGAPAGRTSPRGRRSRRSEPSRRDSGSPRAGPRSAARGVPRGSACD